MRGDQGHGRASCKTVECELSEERVSDKGVNSSNSLSSHYVEEKLDYLEIARRKVAEIKARKAQEAPDPEGEERVRIEAAREEIDRFFVSEILPRLSALYRAGKLPDLSSCLLWQEAEQFWNTLAEGSSSPAPVEMIKAAMQEAVASHERRKA